MSSESTKNMILSGNTKVDGAYHTAEWLLTAFASTLVFIVFIMQVYRIPTGSMAETLRGAHFRLRCEQCGYQYDHDFINERYVDNSGRPIFSETATPSMQLPIQPRSPRCPSCGYAKLNPIPSNGKYYVKKGSDFEPAPTYTVFKGDQIFVQKCIYQFSEPKRWDVIVFKNPTQPQINYIKRCIGLPGETLQIFDGDIYINGQIQRKPQKVQEELWMVIYNNDYQPISPDIQQFNGHTWKQPFQKVGTSQWNLSANGPTVFSLDSDSNTIQRIQYNDTQGNDFRATYAYDDPASYPYMPICSDLMVSYYLNILPQSTAGAQIQKNGMTYQGWISANGTMRIDRLTDAGQPVTVAQSQCSTADLQKVSRFRFSTVDHMVVLEYGKTKLVHDLGIGIDDAGTEISAAPQVQILGMGKLELTHIGLYRDIYYLSKDNDNRVQRASRSQPMVLGQDEFFACGDNSPFSADSRMWTKEGLGNNGKSYPAGIVPKEYLVGKAMVVHWPGGYRVKNERIRWIPFADGFKVIYGGKN